MAVFESDHQISTFYDVESPTRYVSMPLLVPENLWSQSDIFIETLNILKKKKKKLIQSVRFSCLQNWFARSSWFVKFRFVTTLLELCEGLTLLEMLLRNIYTAGTKDAVMVASQQSGYSAYDRMALDDNRDLDVFTLSYVRSLDKVWFMELDDEDRLSVLEGLLLVGGGALTYRVYVEALKLYYERENLNILVSNVKSDNQISIIEDAGKEGMGNMSKTDITEEKEKKEREEEKKKEYKLTSAAEMMKRWMTPVSEEEANVTSQLLIAQQQWKNKLQNLQKLSKRSSLVKKSRKQSKSTDNKEGDSLDLIQLYPLSVSRAICKLLNQEMMNTAKKVNKYWSYMIDETKKEMDMRQKLLKDIAVMENYKTTGGNHRISGDPAPQTQSLKSDSGQSSSLGHRASLFNGSDSCKKAYLSIHNIFTILNDFMSTRVMKCEDQTYKMAVSAPKCSVVFYSLLTGAKLSPHLEGHSGNITCMAFHSDGHSFFTGSADKTIRCWDIWSGHMTRMYVGHTEQVNDISVSDEYIISGGMDKLLKVFHVNAMTCVASLVNQYPVTAVKIHPDTNLAFSGCQNGEIIVYNFITRTIKMQFPAHGKEITSFHLSQPLLLSSSIDGYVKAWDIEEISPNNLLALYHECPVRDVSLSHKQVLSACQDGYFRVWDLLTGNLVRQFKAMQTGRPIFNLHCIQETDNIKIVMSGDSCVKIYEFHPPCTPLPLKGTKKVDDKLNNDNGIDYTSVVDVLPRSIKMKLHPGLKKATLCKGDVHVRRVMLKTQRITALAFRGSTDTSLRYPATTNNVSKAIISDCLRDGCQTFSSETEQLIVFPRLGETKDLHGLPATIPKNLTDIIKSKPKYKQISSGIRNNTKEMEQQKSTPSHKNCLKLYKAFETSL